MSNCACLQILSSQWLSNAAGRRDSDGLGACLPLPREAWFDDQAINCDPLAILRFRVPCDSAAETSQTDVILMVFLARDEDPVPEAPPRTPTRAPLGAQVPGPLTPHEKRLLKLLMQGHRYKTAAAELGVTPHAVSFHLRRVYQKLNVHSKSEAVIKALRENLI